MTLAINHIFIFLARRRFGGRRRVDRRWRLRCTDILVSYRPEQMRDLATLESGDDILQMLAEQIVKGSACGINSCRTKYEHIKFIWNTGTSTLTQRKLCNLVAGAILALRYVHHWQAYLIISHRNCLFRLWLWLWLRFRFRTRRRRLVIC
jgi:hypothetical protein